MTARLAADIGGTFTDLVLLDSGGVVHVAKTLSTPGDFKEGVLSGVERVLSDAGAETEEAIALADVDYFVHGATVVLNALLERKLPKAALVTTRGFRDVLEIMRTNNPRMYDLKWVKPKPIIPRHLRFEVDERVRHTGEVLRPLDEAGTRETARRIKAIDIRSVALCFLHAYANPDHERRAREIILEEHPAAHVTISSDVASELREFERTSTVAINASTIPIISAYLDGLSQALSDRGLERELFVMQSNGGVIASRTARSLPVRTVMSAPAGGVVGAQFIANRMGLRDVATIDIGGTSSDMGVISDGLGADGRPERGRGLANHGADHRDTGDRRRRRQHRLGRRRRRASRRAAKRGRPARPGLLRPRRDRADRLRRLRRAQSAEPELLPRGRDDTRP